MAEKGEIVVMGKFDGGNPQCSADIVKVDDSTFRIYPYSEDRDDNYMFRVDVKVCSSYREPRTVTLFFEWRAWRAERYMEDRKLFYFRHEDGEWSLQQGEIDRNVTKLTLQVPPGENMLCLNPFYNYEMHQQYIKSISKNPFVKAWIAGFSEENRNIWCVKLTDPKIADNKKLRLMIVSRVHPYETAASYCAETMINYLLSEEPEAKKMLANFIFYFVPMPNPDGVYNGLCKLTKVNGFDFSHSNVATSKDRACKSVIGLAREIKPQVLLDIHSLMGGEIDQLGSTDERLLNEFVKLMPDQTEVGRHWKILFRSYEAPKEPPEKRQQYGLRDYCAEELGAISFILGFSWFERSFENMKQTAIKSLRALTAAILKSEAAK